MQTIVLLLATLALAASCQPTHWDVHELYQPGNEVQHEDVLYTAQQRNIGVTPGMADHVWRAHTRLSPTGKEGPRGTEGKPSAIAMWDVGELYERHSVVMHQGHAYFAKIKNMAAAPDMSKLVWVPLSSDAEKPADSSKLDPETRALVMKTIVMTTEMIMAPAGPRTIEQLRERRNGLAFMIDAVSKVDMGLGSDLQKLSALALEAYAHHEPEARYDPTIGCISLYITFMALVGLVVLTINAGIMFVKYMRLRLMDTWGEMKPFIRRHLLELLRDAPPAVVAPTDKAEPKSEVTTPAVPDADLKASVTVHA